MNVAGGVLAWWVLIPLLLFFDPDLPRRMTGRRRLRDVLAYTLWFNVVRPIAVGMMLVAAVNTLFSMRRSLVDSLRGAFALRGAGGIEGAVTERSTICRCVGSWRRWQACLLRPR